MNANRERAVVDDLELIPVVRMSPWDYSECRPPEGVGSRRSDAKTWDLHIKRCLSDAGVSIEPLVSGSDRFRISELTVPAIGKLVAVELIAKHDELQQPGTLLPDPEEFVGALPGGIALRADGLLLVEPGCCCGLENLREWERILTDAHPEWTPIWTGHDFGSVEVRVSPLHAVQFRCEAPWLDGQRTITVSNVTLVTALRSARDSLEAFAEALVPHLQGVLAPDQVALVAKHLAGLT